VRRHAQTLVDHDAFDSVEMAFWKEEPTIEGALERLDADEIVVLPVFTSQGYYAGSIVPEALGLDPDRIDDVQRVAGSDVYYTEAFGTHPDVAEVARSSVRRIIDDADLDASELAVVVAGHGTTEDEKSSQTTEQVAERLRETEDWPEVTTGFMDEPPRVDRAVEETDGESIVVVPFFVSEGGHAAEDIPYLLGGETREDFPRTYEGREVHYAPSIGTEPEIAEILEKRASAGAEKLDHPEGSTEGDDAGWTLLELMAEVGTGPKTAADMTRDQATEAFEQILDDRPDPETLGAFLVANRWKTNTPEELAAFLDVLEERKITVGRDADLDAPLVDCGSNYDGKVDTILLGVASGLVGAELGAPVAVHDGGDVPTKGGTTYRDVLRELGVTLPMDLSESRAMTETYGFGFFDQKQFLPDLAGLVDRRRRLGVRTMFNTVETFANPADADVHLGSFYHLVYATKTIETFQTSRTSNFERAVMVQGLEGYDDIRPGSTQVVVWDDGGEIEDFEIETDALGFDFDRTDLERDSLAAASARATEDVLLGDRRDVAFDAICLNAGVRAYAARSADSIEEGIQGARAAIEEGGPGERLDALRRRGHD